MDNAAKEKLIDKMTGELPVLRARLKLSQGELAAHIGISRQTYSLIETGKQKMTWVTFMAFIGFFTGNEKTKKDLIKAGILGGDFPGRGL